MSEIKDFVALAPSQILKFKTHFCGNGSFVVADVVVIVVVDFVVVVVFFDVVILFVVNN